MFIILLCAYFFLPCYYTSLRRNGQEPNLINLYIDLDFYGPVGMHACRSYIVTAE